MTKDALKKAIIKKFGTMSNFARCSGLDRYYLQTQFSRILIPINDHKAIEKAYRTSEAKDTLGIDEDALDAVKAGIAAAGGAYKFCQDNEEFKLVQVSQLLNGKRVRTSKFVKKLFNHFGIEI